MTDLHSFTHKTMEKKFSIVINIAPVTDTMSVATINDISKPEEAGERVRLTPEQVEEVAELIKSFSNG